MSYEPLTKPTKADRPRRQIDYSTLALPKEGYEPDSEYRAYVRDHGCLLKGHPKHHCQQPIDSCHIAVAGKGLKASDYATVNMCRAAHMQQHAIGWETFQERYGFDRWEVAFRLLERWVRRHA